MADTIEAIVEMALIKMLFTLADLEGLEGQVELLTAKENLRSAIEDLSKVAPLFNFDEQVAAAKRHVTIKKIKPFRVV
jgi:hypothetical protein